MNPVPMTLNLLGGLALFLLGLEIMTTALKTVAGDRLQRVLTKLTYNRFVGVLSGAAVTSIIQSSSVTTVLVVGFTATHLMSLSQAVGVIMGANIGTTVTAQIIAFKVTEYALLFVAGGVLLQFSAGRRSEWRDTGQVIAGLGLVFFGMAVMSDAMRPLRDYQPFLDVLVGIDRPLPAILLAAGFTALVQSSSATIGIVIVMAGHGLISLETGIALAFGANIGTCVTALLAAIGKSREAVRVAVVHVLFNVLGVLMWLGFIGYLAEWTRQISPMAAHLAGNARLAAEVPRQIANANTLFNVANTVLFIGFSGVFARLARRLVPGKVHERETGLRPRYLDTLLLNNPAPALAVTRRELERVGRRVEKMLTAIMPATLHGDHHALENIARMDNEVDSLHSHIVAYLAEIGRQNLTSAQTRSLVQLMEVCNNLEHIGDLIETNLVVLGHQRLAENITIRAAIQEKLVFIQGETTALLRSAMIAVVRQDPAAAQQVTEAKPRIHGLLEKTQLAFGLHLSSDVAEIDAYSLETDILEQFRRIYYFVRRIARTQLPPADRTLAAGEESPE